MLSTLPARGTGSRDEVPPMHRVRVERVYTEGPLTSSPLPAEVAVRGIDAWHCRARGVRGLSRHCHRPLLSPPLPLVLGHGLAGTWPPQPCMTQDWWRDSGRLWGRPRSRQAPAQSCISRGATQHDRSARSLRSPRHAAMVLARPQGTPTPIRAWPRVHPTPDICGPTPPGGTRCLDLGDPCIARLVFACAPGA